MENGQRKWGRKDKLLRMKPQQANEKTVELEY